MKVSATYRIQFHAGFTFADAAELAGYLEALGVTHLYASPIAEARSGSMHGYDVVDPSRISEALGGEQGFRDMAAALRARRIGVVLDIVPNHMAVGGADNAWWQDILENGPESPFARHFDIDWTPADPALQGKVLAPFLGRPYGEALSGGDLRLKVDDRGLAVWAHDHHRFPLRPADVQALRGGDLSAYDARTPEGQARLHELLERQHYRLAWWRTAGDEINWRRFFDITELAGLRIERDEVFEAVHALPLRLYAEGLIDGLRVDHVDGLADPGAYLRKLRARLDALAAERPNRDGPAYLVVEKILAPDEPLPPDWPCDGTSGYDFLNEVSALIHEPSGAEPLGQLWAAIAGRSPDFEDEERRARAEILQQGFAGQLATTARNLSRLARCDLATRDLTEESLRRALQALLAGFPAYRTYARGEAAGEADLEILRRAEAAALRTTAMADRPALLQILAWLRGQGPGPLERRKEALQALQALQQLSAPVAAKSVEDTAFYRYGRLISRNDVGCDPARLGDGPEAFHAAMARRAAKWPRSMLATATHDHKRGEDVRARLAVLSERPHLWTLHVRNWLADLPDHVDPGDVYQGLQTLVGAWPPELDPQDDEGVAAFGERVGRWQVKALREAKLRTSWLAPDEAYETRCREETVGRLDDRAFREQLHGFVERIAPGGALNGLAQALLRCAAPGVPDTYQGCEFWDFSLVDPDNRRPVDYALRMAALASGAPAARLVEAWRTGAIKQHVIARTLSLRRLRPGLFSDAAYRPIGASGLRSGSVLAFERGGPEGPLLVACAIRAAAALEGASGPTLSSAWWNGTELAATASPTGRWVNRLTGEVLAGDGALAAQNLFATLPVALLTAD
ncbi:MAG: malto-oligosyltrehalose synthase [Phenylobacterium sp.]|uniref:malto-oligosyltrehalose synthase n=1 Tax=Phenylobacterium sp. TaxID=1871053 RepID=UPI0017D6298B|nr:malto-oligosyltrehalose synthase [Phenylobacterium sp.]MBA4792670.1 malto-oligosyltrehalose synthase [Phenylobacterium sp.]